ncbi:HAMP domain-containing sensor histidine kinase [Lacticaseibacillus hegangensis]|uniref:histidine kinase n=1 Tax=Lacticaseibacillus hegangensis TaxID=2486010 RepID=A0ABW4D0G4_9LACO|nr:HAMP domain-containing sensor histidine kinase [Lacticaseibacillus hegangensis]
MPNRSSSAVRMARAYNGLIIALMVMIFVSVISVVGGRLIKNKRDDAVQVMTTLQHTFANHEPDWDYWRDNAPLNTRLTFVRVRVRQPDGQVTDYYTRHTKDFLEDNFSTWPLFSNVQYQRGQGVYYHVRKVVDQSGWRTTYSVWLSLNNMIEIFKLILLMTLLVTAVGVILGTLGTKWLAKRLNRPLVALTQATKQITDQPDSSYHERLPVPEAPQEVRELSQEFNRLLHSLNDQVIRDNQFVSDASHELRTPLTAIRGHVALLRRHGQAHPELIPDSLAVIDDESMKMQKLIESLLALSRMDHAEVQVAPFDLAGLTRRVVSRFSPQSKQTLKVVLPEQLPVLANAESVEHALLSLLSNANKYVPANTIVTVSGEKVGGHVELSVADLGPGIPDSEKSHVFDRFFRLDESRSKAISGTGLGLAITRRLITLSGGTIRVVDNQPRGSRFIINLKTPDSENL